MRKQGLLARRVAAQRWSNNQQTIERRSEMMKDTNVMQTLTLNVPEDTREVTVHLQVDAQCKCASQPTLRPGSYVDAEPARSERR
ncbi:hypothetical protein ASG77_12600 [Arthrobacter sp. Soil762]|nr:hypothetical protein ASG77_12600 [Arthrobacter sp. Soil762]